MEILAGHGLDLPAQRVARICTHRRAVEVIHGQQHLAARRAGAEQRLQRAGQGPAAQVAIARIPDQAGLVDILAGDIEAEDGDRQVAAILVEPEQLLAADDLAAPDAVRIRKHDVEGFDVRMGGEEFLRLRDLRSRR